LERSVDDNEVLGLGDTATYGKLKFFIKGL
jgi:hypothetical protein